MSGDVLHRVPEEIVRPIAYVPEEVNLKLPQPADAARHIAEVKCDLAGLYARLGDPSLKSSEKVLRVTLDDQLDTTLGTVFPCPDNLYEHVGKGHLHLRMKVQFWLFKYDGRVGFGVQTLH